MQEIDPAAVPSKTLASGARMPAIGLGTFGSDNYTAEQVAQAVLGAAQVGYRHFDCASVYGNEAEIGKALAAIQQSGVRREDLWITSKVWNDCHGPGQAIESCKRSLRDLKLEYLDLYLIHWPFPNHHAKGVDVSSRDPHARPYIHDDYMAVWRQMEQLAEQGLVRHIGTSNMTIRKLELLLRDCHIRPAANEMELHPHFQQPALFDFVVKQGLIPIGYSPIGSPSRPERDRAPGDTADMEDPVILEIARRHSVHPAIICIKWAVQRGQAPIPFSVKPAQYLVNLQAVVDDPLTAEEMGAIAGIDRNNRLIKGQVFLWPGAPDWRALWDEEAA